MKVTAFVPIKMNNERVPGKNTKCFDDGTTLITFLNAFNKVTGFGKIYFCGNLDIKNFLRSNMNY